VVDAETTNTRTRSTGGIAMQQTAERYVCRKSGSGTLVRVQAGMANRAERYLVVRSVTSYAPWPRRARLSGRHLSEGADERGDCGDLCHE